MRLSESVMSFGPFADRGVSRGGDSVILYRLTVGLNEFVCGLNDRPKLNAGSLASVEPRVAPTANPWC